MITRSWTRSGVAITFICFQEVAIMKTLNQPEGLPEYCMAKGSGMNWISGDRSGGTTGQPGERCYHIILGRDSENACQVAHTLTSDAELPTTGCASLVPA